MRRSQIIMGTGVSIDIPGAKEDIFEKVFERLHEIDRRFSPYKKNSELCRYNRDELKEADLSREMKFVTHACRRVEEKTNGYFNAWYKGQFEPSGYVKGWAIAEAGKIIEVQGFKTFCVYIGGDVLACSAGDKVWNIAIQDPTDKSKILNKLSISSGAVATSGNYERGRHIVNPKTGLPADELASVTVFGPNIISADVLATACFAAGREWQKAIKNYPDYKIIIVSRIGKILHQRQNSLT